MSETKQILVDVKDLTDMLESSQVDIEAEYAQVALDNIRDTLRFILHDSGALIDPGIAQNDGVPEYQTERESLREGGELR